ncbi:hypothetical protein [Desulfoscipio geothermicus]|nr:hypothetical protein [Desulfoscipio geothermicus]
MKRKYIAAEDICRNIIFDKKLNNFARKYLVKGNECLVEYVMNFEAEHDSLSAMVGEFLMLHEGVAFSVYGEKHSFNHAD